MVSYLNEPGLLKQRSFIGDGMALYLVVCLVMPLFEMLALKWVPLQSQRKAGTHITKRKASYWGAHYSYLFVVMLV